MGMKRQPYQEYSRWVQNCTGKPMPPGKTVGFPWRQFWPKKAEKVPVCYTLLKKAEKFRYATHCLKSGKVPVCCACLRRQKKLPICCAPKEGEKVPVCCTYLRRRERLPIRFACKSGKGFSILCIPAWLGKAGLAYREPL